METTKNKMPEYNTAFFDKLKIYLDTPLYYFGSVQRDDYFPESSDIDVDIFTDNVKSTLSKLRSFLNVRNNEFKEMVWRSNYDNSLVKGYKIMYNVPERGFSVEFSIYDEKYKELVLMDHNGKRVLPIYATWALIFIKCLYYSFNIMPKEWYRYFKEIILSTLISVKRTEFVVI